MDLSEYAALLRKRWRSMLAILAATLLAAVLATVLLTPRYSASTLMFFAVPGGESVAELAQGSAFTEQQMGSFVQAARSALVLDRVAGDLGLPMEGRDLARSIDVRPVEKTTVLEIRAADPDPHRATDIANAVAAELATATAELTPARADGTQSVVATVLTPAYVPASPSSPNLLVNLTLGAVLGLLLALAFAVVRQVADTKVRDQRDLASVTDSTAVIGTVPLEPGGDRRPVFMREHRSGRRAEAIRRLRVNLRFVHRGGEPRTIVLTSSVPGEGKTTTAINLALSFADAGSRVILVDADLRRPCVAEYLGLEGAVGLTTALIGAAEISDVVQPWQGSSLDVLPSGEIPPNPSELLGSVEMSMLLAGLAETYDVVVLDSPPLLAVADATLLSRLTSGTVLLAGADRVHKAQVRQALESLAMVDARVLGVVLNKVSRRRDEGYYGYPPSSPASGRSGVRQGRHPVDSATRGR
ncbi:polysaccharide biosynthesis tyrosine autokinase [Georgenia thermotolerans]|uniref:non-specific protein-tyrosine kinase n=1 Tax=Georgenia thermotolerans TaxID=527326 RepID=A0A7J5UR97_9MICO|nr:polysaccharide biosynthesis tyrosine autokinase [Georgenia thermotolerans]KAE8764403.1 polysaccharide biosynthesis tyrosine autokinase [Georgenia thermotolerans]